MIAIAAAAAPSPARADDLPTVPERRFYKGYDYGSQSLYNPFYVLLNRGYDTIQLRPHNRSVYGQNLGANITNVVDNVGHPGRAIRIQGGFEKFARQELFPLSFTPSTARWVPNYSLHLLGGGQTYVQLREWFDAHDAPVPAAWSILTLYASAFVNEGIENRDVDGPNTDCIADLMVFDIAGVLLFSIEPVAKFFSSTMIIADWSLQPVITSTRGEIHNVGNYFALKFPLPFHPQLRIFAYGGYATEFGLSYKFGEYSLSVSGGGRFTNFENAGTNAVVNTVNTVPAGGIFFDRNESLLVSMQVSNITDYFAHLNVYPNAFFRTDPGIGFFFALSKDTEHFVTGVSFTRSIGFGLGASNL